MFYPMLDYYILRGSTIYMSFFLASLATIITSVSDHGNKLIIG